jgi:hypothetical protein
MADHKPQDSALSRALPAHVVRYTNKVRFATLTAFGAPFAGLELTANGR